MTVPNRRTPRDVVQVGTRHTPHRLRGTHRKFAAWPYNSLCSSHQYRYKVLVPPAASGGRSRSYGVTPMRTQYRCPVDGCSKVFNRAIELRSHMAGTMQYEEDHKWRNVPISHHDLSAAEETVAGITDYGE